MNLKKVQDCERNKLERWSRFQLPFKYKKVGLILSLAAFVVLIGLKFTETEPEWLRFVLRQMLLVGLLVISLSKEKVEDEMITSLRTKAYFLAFIFGVFYAMVQPIANYIVDIVLASEKPMKEVSYFQVLFFMLIIQIMFFEILKRNR